MYSIEGGARTYSQAYRDRGLAPENLSRAVENSATVTAYLPFAFFCWLSPIVTIIFGMMGWTITRISPDETEATGETARPSADAATPAE